MTTTQHTSGPWRVWQNRISPTESEFEILDSEDYKIASVARWREEKHESEANAHLLAAAPEILAILKKWAVRIDDSCDDSLVINRTMTAAEVREINAAIAKAEGK